jgi:nucleoside-diphosphate-sugar epimerase
MSDAVGVTGPSGFIGSHLCNELGSIALPLDLRKSSDDAIRDLLVKTHCQTIVHLASPMYNKSKLQPISPKTSCEELTLRLLEILQPLRPFNLIFLSSVRVHPRGSKIFSPESPIDPIDAYGKDKHATERLLMKSYHKTFCIRASSVQGVDLEGKARGIIGIFSRQAKDQGSLQVMGDGKSTKDLLHVSDLCELIKLSINSFGKLTASPLPAGGGSPCSLLNLAKDICLRTRTEIRQVAPDPFDLSGQVDNSSIYKSTGWQPKVSLDRMIQEALSHSQNA